MDKEKKTNAVVFIHNGDVSINHCFTLFIAVKNTLPRAFFYSLIERLKKKQHKKCFFFCFNSKLSRYCESEWEKSLEKNLDVPHKSTSILV